MLHGFMYWIAEQYDEDMADLDGVFRYAHFMYDNKLSYITITNDVGTTYYEGNHPDDPPEIDQPGFLLAELKIGDRTFIIYDDDSKWPYHECDVIGDIIETLEAEK